MLRIIPVLTFLSFIVFSCENIKESPNSLETPEELSALFEPSLKPFYHGVASGDPLRDRVIIWTRITPEKLESVTVTWEVSTSSTFSEIVRSGEQRTSVDKDFTVKVDVDGLSPDTRYYYRFMHDGVSSIIGETKTIASSSVDSLKFAIVSCSNYEFGYFNTYEQIALRDDIDAVLHLGDYIYEYGPGRYGDTVQYSRRNFPKYEIISLRDYRYRYAQYRLDSDLRLAHQKVPFIPIWDDHEIANNSYKTGAQNHQDDEGSYENRKAAAAQAYYEWLPIREDTKLYRSFNFGDLCKLVMLDERLEGRTAIPDSLNDPQREAPEHTMLGKEQIAWFQEEIATSEQRWKVIGNQVIFSYLNWGWPSFKINLDSWDGYPMERKQIADFIRTNEIKNIVFVTGDTHSSWAFEVTEDPFNDYNATTSEGAIAVEFGTTSINSSNSNESTPTDTVIAHEQKIVGVLNPHLKYANLRDHGFLLLSIYQDSSLAEWYYVEDLANPKSADYLGKRVRVDLNSHKLY